MGNPASKENKQAKLHRAAEKAAFQAREARAAADAARAGIPYEKKKWTPPGTYESRPSDRETVSKPEMRGHGVEFDAVPYEIDSDRLHRVVRPVTYRAVELPPAEVEPGRWRTQQARYREYEYPQHFVQSQNPNKEQREAEDYRNQLIRDRDAIDQQLKRADAQYREEANRHRELTRQHRETQLLDVDAMENLQKTKRARAEIERLEKQLAELKEGKAKIFERERSEFEAHYHHPDLSREKERLDRLHAQDRQLSEEEQGLEKSLKTVQSARTPEDERLNKLSQEIDRLQREKEVVQRKALNLRNEETEKGRRRDQLKAQRAQMHREKQAAAQHKKELEKEAAILREREWKRRQTELEKQTPSSAQLEFVRHKKEQLSRDEEEASRRKKATEDALNAEDEALAASREMMDHELEMEKRLVEQKPIVSAKEYQKQYSMKKAELVSNRAENAPISTREHHNEPIFVEKHKEVVKTAKGKVVPDAPPLTEKTTNEFVLQQQKGGGLKEEHFTTPEGLTRQPSSIVKPERSA